MRLTFKFIVAVACAILVVLGLNAFVRVQREVALFESDIRRDSHLYGQTLAGAASRIWTTVGEAETLDLVEDADERENHLVIRWLWLDTSSVTERLPPDVLSALLAGREAVTKGPSPDGEGQSLYVYVPVALPGGRVAAIELRESLAAEQRYLRRSILQATIATVVLVLICGLLATVLGFYLIGRPVRRLVEQARRIGTGDLSLRLTPRGRDEIADLAREMNAMCESLLEARKDLQAETATRQATQEQLRHADRLNTVGKLAAGIAHEVGTPLNVIIGHAQLIKDEYPADTPAHENVVIIAEQAHRVAAIIRQLLDFARQRTLRTASHELGGLARQVVTLLDSLAQKRSVVLEFTAPDQPIHAEVDAGQIQQVVTNLVVNGIQAMNGGGRLTVGLARVRKRPPSQRQESPRSYACISVEDGGVGIPEEALASIFEPFFTTKGVGEGTGLGLSVAYGIVKEHGGWIDVRSTLGQGSCFSVYLPAEDTHA